MRREVGQARCWRRIASVALARIPALLLAVTPPAVVLTLVSGARVAAAEPSTAAAAPTPQLSLQLDGNVLLAAGRTAKPTSIFSDPACAPTLAHIVKQLELLGGGKPGWAASAGSGLHRLDLRILPPVAGDPDPRRARFALFADHDAARAVADALGAVALDPKPGEVGGLAGVGNGEFFVGAAGTSLALGDPATLRALHPLPADPKRPALSIACDFAPMIELVKALEGDGITYGLDPLVPKWRAEAPTLEISAAPAGESWTGTVALKAGSLPFHSIDPALAALARTGKHARFAAGLDPRAVAGLIGNLASERDERALAVVLGCTVADAAKLFTGDVLLMVDASGIIPQGVLALRLRPEADASALVQAAAAAYQGQKIEAGAEVVAYALDTPLGPWGLAAGKRLLVIGNDPDLAQDLLAGKAGDAPIPAGKAVVADIDLPLIAKQWLPLAYRMLGDARLELGADPLGNVQFRLPEGAIALVQTLGAAAKLSLLAQPTPPPLTLTRNGATLPWIPPPQLGAQLRALLPNQSSNQSSNQASTPPSIQQTADADLAVAIDASFSVFADPAATPDSFATIVRLADGWHVLEDDRRGRKLPLSSQQLASRLGALKRVLGSEPEKLRLLAPPVRPSIDRRWLPELGVLLRHVPAYHLEATLTPAGITAEERGAPLGTLAAALGVIDMALLQEPRLLQYHLRSNDHAPPALPTPPVTPGTVEF